MSNSSTKPADINSQINAALLSLRKGGIIAYPTETFYGLGVDPLNELAVDKLFSLKKRPAQKPISLIISNKEMLSSLVDHLPSLYEPLIKRYWPGPLTLIFQAHRSIHHRLTGGTGTLAIRISPHPIAQKICREINGPITATSANFSGGESPTTVNQVKNNFGKNVECYIDGGDCPGGLSSTIVSIEDERLTLVRPGKIDFQSLNRLS